MAVNKLIQKFLRLYSGFTCMTFQTDSAKVTPVSKKLIMHFPKLSFLCCSKRCFCCLVCLLMYFHQWEVTKDELYFLRKSCQDFFYYLVCFSGDFAFIITKHH